MNIMLYPSVKTGILFSMALFFNGLSAQSNEGTEFWFGFMEHFDVGQNTMVAMITSRTNTTGVISMPGRNWSDNFSVSANDVTVVELPQFAEHIGSEKIENLGILLQSNDPVSVYIHQYHSMRSEATVVLPMSSIGMEYFVMTYRGVRFGGADFPSELLIVALKDETQVRVELESSTKGGKSKGEEIILLLNRGESYQIQTNDAIGDLTGSFVNADKKIAVFGGNVWTEVPNGCPARDNLLEQMYPVGTWGTKFVSVPNAQTNFDIFRILAAEDNTSVKIVNRSTQTVTLNKTEFKEYRISEASYFESNKPILIAQFNVGSSCSGHSLGDPSMVLLNSVEQIRDKVTMFNSRFQFIDENYINIITRSEDTSTVMVDGLNLGDQGITFQTAGENGEFSFVRLSVNAGAHTIESLGCGVIVTAYGYGNVESYAYSGGASFAVINENPIPEGGCLNDTVFFRSELSPKRFKFDWDLGDGTTSTELKFRHYYPNLGSYPVRLVIEDICLNTKDTLTRDLMITLRQAVDVAGDTLLCENENFSLEAADVEGARYEWRGPNEYFSKDQFPIVENAEPGMSGFYEVIGIVSGCATYPATAIVEVFERPRPELGKDDVICPLEGFSKVLDPGVYNEYLWNDGSSGRSVDVFLPGTYTVSVSNEYGCVGSDTIRLDEQCPTEYYIPNIFNPSSILGNSEFGVTGHDIIQMELIVYDRWGNRIFTSSGINEKWDGKYNGNEASPGVYVWTLEFTGYRENGEIFSTRQNGTVNLLR